MQRKTNYTHIYIIPQYLSTLKGADLVLELGTEFYWTCVYCQKTGTQERGPDGRGWHIDHAYPKALGGDDDPDNLILACATCNIRKGKKTAIAVLKIVFEKMACDGHK